MKSVKSKLFIGFSLVIFIILFALSFLSIKLFFFTQKSELFEKIEQTLDATYRFIESSSDRKIQELDRYIQLENQFVVILKDENILYSSESDYKTRRILEETYDELDEDDDRYEKRHDHYKENNSNNKRDRDDKHFFDDDFMIAFEDIQKGHHHYELIVGVDEKLFDHQMDDIVLGIIIFVLIIFFILLGFGYLLISRTIRPLKLILHEVNALREGNDLSKRLQSLNSKDEFESLVNTLNEMFGNIEKSVESIKQFSSDASHELKTPLTIIQGEIELAQNQELSSDELKEVIAKINKEQKKLQTIIQNFLLLSRLEKESVQTASSQLDTVVLDVIESNLEKVEAKGLALCLEIEENLNINFEARYLTIVVDNLLSNAIKYTNEGTITLKAFEKEGHCYFSIQDTGMGIDKKDYENIFERFFRVDKVRTDFSQGVGLGLSIVKKICDRFNTKIHVQSSLNEGSTFILEFSKEDETRNRI